LGFGESSTDFSTVMQCTKEFLVCEFGKVDDCYGALGAVSPPVEFWVQGFGIWWLRMGMPWYFAGALVIENNNQIEFN
jgi:hypothetical protein